MRKLKIAFLSAGTFTHIGPYIDFFKKQGHEVFLIAYDKPNRDYGVPTFDISYGANSVNQFSKWKYLLAGISIRKVLKEIKPDILHGHYVTSAGVISLMSGFRPYALTVHGSDLIGSMSSFFWKRILGVAFTKAALINPVSDELGDIVKGMGMPEDKILVSTLGVDTGCFAFNPKVRIQSPVQLLCTRTLGRVYDPGTIVNACSILKGRQIPFQLTFAAGGSTESEVKMLVDQKGLTNEINFMGGYDNKLLPQLLHDHDIYLSASFWDGTSISLLEAMSCGIFPIVSRITSNQAWLTDGQDCFMFECGNAQELAEKIAQAVNRPSLVASAIEDNRRRVEMKADRNTNMLKLEEWYYKIL